MRGFDFIEYLFISNYFNDRFNQNDFKRRGKYSL